MFKLLWNILCDERGTWWAVGTMAVGTIINATAGKSKMKTIDPYAKQRGEYTNYLSTKLGKSTPYQYNEAFTLDQPEVESALQSTILGGLNKGSGLKTDIMDTMNKYQQSRVASLEGQKEKDLKDTGNMYNRLGLVSSSPGLAAQDEVRSDYGLKLNELNADVARQGIGYEMDAERLSEDILNNYMGQAQVLGGAQRGYQMKSIEMSEADIERMTNEELKYASLMGALINGNPPEYYFKDNWARTLGSGMANLGGSMMTGNILGGAGKTAGTVGSVPKYQSIIGSQG